MKRFRPLLYLVLLLGGCHFFITGSPVPLWHIEELRDPVAVASVTASHLVLSDGRSIALPFVKEIPHDDPLFRAALADGIEVAPGGEAWGLLWLDRMCGNDPVVNLLLLCLFRDLLQGAALVNLRKAVSFAVAPSKHRRIRTALGVSLYRA